jgi:hypothetical protein
VRSRISVKEAENVVEHLSALLEEAEVDRDRVKGDEGSLRTRKAVYDELALDEIETALDSDRLSELVSAARFRRFGEIERNRLLLSIAILKRIARRDRPF